MVQQSFIETETDRTTVNRIKTETVFSIRFSSHRLHLIAGIISTFILNSGRTKLSGPRSGSNRTLLKTSSLTFYIQKHQNTPSSRGRASESARKLTGRTNTFILVVLFLFVGIRRCANASL